MKRIKQSKAHSWLVSFSTVAFAWSIDRASGFQVLLLPPSRSRQHSITAASSSSSSSPLLVLHAKRNKRAQARQDEADLNRWYESVDADASPDDVFWEEMERQRLLSKSGGGGSDDGGSGMNPYGSGGMGNPNMNVNSNTGVSQQTLAKTNSLIAMAAMNGQTQKSTEATLSEYASFMVPDNWLDDELVWMMQQDDEFEMDDGGEHVPTLDEQLDAWEALEDGDDFQDEDEEAEDNEWMSSDDPWDHFGKEESDEESARLQLDSKNPANAYLLDESEPPDLNDPETVERLSKITCRSRRLERAKDNPKAKAFFGQGPDEDEGYEKLWASAVDNACFRNLKGVFRNFGIQFADNFGDWKDESLHDSLASIEDVASYKARQVYNVTGLPCIASRTSFEVEPVPDLNTGGSGAGGRAAVANANPRVASGYRFNDVGAHVDYICEALRPLSQPDRVTRFRTCLCYFDGEMEVFDYGVCDVDILYANSLRTFIPVSQAINEMMRTLELTFGLDSQRWIKGRVDEAIGTLGTAGVKLRDMVLKEGKVLPNDIIDVSAFMDSKIDVNLMDECAKELSDRAMQLKPSKILTVATTGLVIALPMAKYLQVPVVYARKERNVVMADTYKAGFSSKTVGKNRELLVSKSHIDEEDRILIVDDFLSSGSSQEALLRIVSEAGATPVGMCVLLEKVYDSGRQSLSGYDVPIHSLCRIASVQGGVIQLLEEEGFGSTKRKTTSL